jgi:hypothetical protein
MKDPDAMDRDGSLPSDQPAVLLTPTDAYNTTTATTTASSTHHSQHVRGQSPSPPSTSPPSSNVTSQPPSPPSTSPHVSGYVPLKTRAGMKQIDLAAAVQGELEDFADDPAYAVLCLDDEEVAGREDREEPARVTFSPSTNSVSHEAVPSVGGKERGAAKDKEGRETKASRGKVGGRSVATTIANIAAPSTKKDKQDKREHKEKESRSNKHSAHQQPHPTASPPVGFVGDSSFAHVHASRGGTGLSTSGGNLNANLSSPIIQPVSLASTHSSSSSGLKSKDQALKERGKEGHPESGRMDTERVRRSPQMPHALTYKIANVGYA